MGLRIGAGLGLRDIYLYKMIGLHAGAELGLGDVHLYKKVGVG